MLHHNNFLSLSIKQATIILLLQAFIKQNTQGHAIATSVLHVIAQTKLQQIILILMRFAVGIVMLKIVARDYKLFNGGNVGKDTNIGGASAKSPYC
jgi:hypothetical protein